MEMSKKGVFFITIAITIVIVVILSFNLKIEYQSDDRGSSEKIRVETMNAFIRGLEDDVDNALFISGFRSLLSLEDYMMEHQDFLDNLGINLQDAFEEAFTQGTINGQKMKVMVNNTFTNWTSKMINEANKTDILLDITIDSVELDQSGPWKVEVVVDLQVDVDDKKGTASWSFDREYTRQIDVSNFVDPLYLVKSEGLVNNTIRKTTVANFSTTSNLREHLKNNYYIENADAPSYLDRFEFENNMSGSAYGIESLVNSSELNGLGIGLPLSETAVDHLYFDGTSPTSDCNIEGMEDLSWFYLDHDPDPSHMEGTYNAECDS